MDNEKVSLSYFNTIKVIGKGSFAKVVLVKKKGSENLYAMKILKKKYIEKLNKQRYAMIERDILKTMDHPFIVKMYHSFQNNKKLFFILEYCPGGELFNILSQRRKIPEAEAKFYAAQILLALEYLHERNIIYRDLKAQNVLIDSLGYLRITDFGLSKPNAFEWNSLSVCGTPQYLAPEVLLKKGHGKPFDWWCFGSLIYEMVIGLPPFYTQNRGQLATRIKQKNPKFPKDNSPAFKDLVNRLLDKHPETRLGTKGAEEIKNHPWFEGLDWNQLLGKAIQAPFIPPLNNKLDTQNFSQDFTKCEVDSGSQCSARSEEGRYSSNQQRYSDFSYDKSPEERMDLEQGNSDFQMNIVREDQNLERTITK